MNTVADLTQRWMDNASTQQLEAKLTEYENARHGPSGRDIEMTTQLIRRLREELKKRYAIQDTASPTS